MKVKLIAVTVPQLDGVNSAADLIAYCARVSNPSNQLNSMTYGQLINYLIKHKHWSPFEMASMCVEIKTSRAIAAQILRHRSFSFQEFSQRYAKVQQLEEIELRIKGSSNRQGSSDELADNKSVDIANNALDHALRAYDMLLEAGVAKEAARMVLPLATSTTLYMSGTLRSWIHYLMIRDTKETQKEHSLIAKEIKGIFKDEFPTIYKAIFEKEKE